MRKISNYETRTYSPIKSPRHVQPLSPFRRSPFQHQQLSPLKSRRFERTPKKYDYDQNQKQFYRSPRNTNYANSKPINFNNQQRYQGTKQYENGEKREELNYMQKTIKKGVGLFQQLAHQSKLNSDKKENHKSGQQGSNSKNYPGMNISQQYTQPFECSAKVKENSAANINSQNSNQFNIKNASFGALLQNVKQIQSIQGYYPTSSNNNRDLSPASAIQIKENTAFKAAEKVNKAKTEVSTQPTVYANQCIAQSFGSLFQNAQKAEKYSEITLKKQNDFQKASPKSEISPHYSNYSSHKKNAPSNQFIPSVSEYIGIQNPKPVSTTMEYAQKTTITVDTEQCNRQLPRKSSIVEQSQDYDDVLSLIKKVSDNMNSNNHKSSLCLNQLMEDSVKVSIKDEDSFNMNPFL